MTHRSLILTIAMMLAVVCTRQSRSAFVVEAHETGLAFGNFEFALDTTMASDSIPSTALGLQAAHSIFGGDGIEFPDAYSFSYTLGVDQDNFHPNPGTALGSKDGSPGDGYQATGLLGGTSGFYHVYVTSPASVNVSGAPSMITITQSEEPLFIDELDVNSGENGLGIDTQRATRGPFVGGLNNAWLWLGTVELLAGETYSLTMEAEENTFVSQRVHGVMWERAALFSGGDVDGDGVLTAADIDLITAAVASGTSEPRFDVDGDGLVATADRNHWIEQLRRTWAGDANLDGEFDSSDFVSVFQQGEYEDQLEDNSTWASGDWTGDLEFDSTDFVRAFQSGAYEMGPRPPVTVPEPAFGLMCSSVMIMSTRWRARQRSRSYQTLLE